MGLVPANVAATLADVKGAPTTDDTLIYKNRTYKWFATSGISADDDKIVASDDAGFWITQWAADLPASDGNSVQDNVAVAADPTSLLALTRTGFATGSRLRTSDGFIYEVADPSATDQHLTTAGGVKLYVADSAISPDALGAPCDAVGDDAPFFERAFKLSPTVQLRSTSVYRLASIIGLPGNAEGQGLYADQALRLEGNGATVTVSSPLVNGSPEGIFTSAAAKLDPESISDLYVGKFVVKNINWKQDGASVIFNGDRIYELLFAFNSVDDVDTIIKSFRPRGGTMANPTYPQGYVQSPSIIYNQLSGVRRVIDAKRGFDIEFTGNKCSSCLGGVYVDGSMNPAIDNIRWIDNLWQGGGLAGKFGKILGGTFIGGYHEANSFGDAATAKCEFWLYDAGGGPSSSVSFDGFIFQSTADQAADIGYVAIRIDAQGVRGLPRITSCWSTTARLVSPNRAETEAIDSSSADVLRLSGSALSPQSARRTTIGGTVQFLASTNLSGGIFRVASVDMQYLKSMLADNERAVRGQIDILMQHRTVGGVVNGTSHAIVSFLVMGASEGQSASRRVDDVYATFSMMLFEQIAAGQPIETQFGSTTRTHFTNPSLSFVRNGDKFDLKLSGYSAPSNPNFGAADRILSHVTVQADARNNSTVLTSPLAIGA